MQSIKSKKSRGFSLIEIVIASSILLLVIVSIFSAFILALKTSTKNTASVQAAFLLEEGHEALRDMRNWGWDQYIGSLSNETSYRLSWNSHWQATTSPDFIDDKFDRTFLMSPVYRDGNHNIVIIMQGGVLDPNTKRVTVTVAWNNGSSTTTKTMESYVSDIFTN